MKCEICRKETEYICGKLKEGVIEVEGLIFCSDRCYEIWRDKNDM